MTQDNKNMTLAEELADVAVDLGVDPYCFWDFVAIIESQRAQAVEEACKEYESILVEGVSRVYSSVTDGKCTKANADPSLVIAMSDDYMNEVVEENIEEYKQQNPPIGWLPITDEQRDGKYYYIGGYDTYHWDYIGENKPWGYVLNPTAKGVWHETKAMYKGDLCNGEWFVRELEGHCEDEWVEYFQPTHYLPIDQIPLPEKPIELKKAEFFDFLKKVSESVKDEPAWKLNAFEPDKEQG